jgi:hypothetical protein
MAIKKDARLRWLVPLGCVSLLVILTFWAQSKVCVYWLPNMNSVQNALWLTANLIQFNDSRIIDWR